jgi:hypothetical protein
VLKGRRGSSGIDFVDAAGQDPHLQFPAQLRDFGKRGPVGKGFRLLHDIPADVIHGFRQYDQIGPRIGGPPDVSFSDFQVPPLAVLGIHLDRRCNKSCHCILLSAFKP